MRSFDRNCHRLRRRRTLNIERLESRRLLTAAFESGDVSLDTPESLRFEPTVVGRDLRVSRTSGLLAEGVVDRFAFAPDGQSETSFYADSPLAANHRYIFSLIDENGGNVFSSIFVDGDSPASAGILDAGEYVLEVTHASQVFGTTPYDLRVFQGSIPLETMPEPVIPFPRMYEVEVGGVMARGWRPEDTDRFPLGSLGAGTEVDVTVSVPDFGTATPIVELVQSNHVVIDDLDPSSERLRAVVPVAGTYSIRVRYETIFEGSRYVQSERGLWPDVDREARGLGGHIVSINSPQEQELVASLLASSWIGIRVEDVVATEALRWTSGEPISYTNWSASQPAETGFAIMSGRNAKWQILNRYLSHEYSVIEVPARANDPPSSIAGPDALYFLEITVRDSVPPDVASTEGIPTHGIRGEFLIHSFEVKFSEELLFDKPLVELIELREAGDDGEWMTEDDVIVSTENRVCCDSSARLEIEAIDGPLADGFYRLTLSPELTDRFDNSLGEGSGYTTTFEIAAITDQHVFEGTANDSREQATLLPLARDENGTDLFRSPRSGLGMIEKGGDFDFWSFDATAGSTVLVQVVGDTCRMSIELTDDAGEVLANNGDESWRRTSEVPPTRLETTGTYYVRIGEDVRHYELRVDLFDMIAVERESEDKRTLDGSVHFSVAENPRIGSVAGTLTSSDYLGRRDRFDLGILSAGAVVELSSRLPHWGTLQPFVSLVSETYGTVLDVDVSETRFQGTTFHEDRYFAEIDADRGHGIDGQYVIDARIDETVPPRVLSVRGLPESGVTGEILGSVTLVMSEEVALVDGNDFDLREAGADGLFDTDDDRRFLVSPDFGSDDAEVIASFSDGPLFNGSYRLKVLPSLTDRSGNPLGGGTPQIDYFQIRVLDIDAVFEGADNDRQEKATQLPVEVDPDGTGLLRSRTGIGVLESLRDVDWWSFESVMGDDVRITNSSGSGVSVDVFDSDGRRVAIDRTHGTDARIAQFNARHDGTYFVRIESSDYASHRSLRSYQIRVDMARDTDMELREQANMHRGHGRTFEIIHPEPPDDVGRGSITGTLLEDDQDTFDLGLLEENVVVQIAIDRPAWSDVSPVVSIPKYNAPSIPLTPENGVFRFVTDTRSEYEIRLSSDEQNSGAGWDGQYVLRVSVSSNEPLNVIGLDGIPEDGGRTDQLLTTFELEFSRFLDRESVGDAAVSLVHAGEDDQFDTSDDREIPLGHQFARDRFRRIERDRIQFYVDGGLGALTEGSYRLSLPPTIRSELGHQLGYGDGFATSFSVSRLPDPYVFENPANGNRLGATHLEPLSPLSPRLHRGVGVLEDRHDDDWWSFDAGAGDYVSIWTPSRSDGGFFRPGLVDDTGESVFRINYHWLRDIPFVQYQVQKDGRYYVNVGSTTLGLPDDRLYEIWIDVQPYAEGTPLYERNEIDYAEFVPNDGGSRVVVASEFYGSDGFLGDDQYELGVQPLGTHLRAEVFSTHWSFKTPRLELLQEDQPLLDGEGGVLDTFFSAEVPHQLLVELAPRRLTDPEVPGVSTARVDYIVRVELAEAVPIELLSIDIEGSLSNYRDVPAFIDITFSEDVVKERLSDGVTILRNGTPMDSKALELTRGSTSGAVRVLGLDNIALEDGEYEVVVDNAFSQSVLSGAKGVGTASRSWTLDTVPPQASIEVGFEANAYQVRASADDDVDPRFAGTGIVGTSIFAVEGSIVRHMQTVDGSSAEVSYRSESDDAHFFAVAADGAGNRSTLDLRSDQLESISIDSDLAEDIGIFLPSRIVVDVATSVTWTGNWDVLSPIREGDRRIHRLAVGDRIVEVAGPSTHQNPLLRHDVDHNGVVSAVDALTLINQLELSRTELVGVEYAGDFYLDVNGDSRFTALDVLLVINQLGQGSSEAPVARTTSIVDPLDTSDFAIVTMEDQVESARIRTVETPARFATTYGESEPTPVGIDLFQEDESIATLDSEAVDAVLRLDSQVADEEKSLGILS